MQKKSYINCFLEGRKDILLSKRMSRKLNKTINTQKQGSIELKFLLYTTPVHPQEDGTPNFFNESRSSLLVLSIDVSFVLNFFWKGDKNFKNLTSGPIYMEDPVLLLRL